MEKETVQFQGHTYTRYPGHPVRHSRVYFNPGVSDKMKYGLEVLHREVWKAHHGPIPKGCIIHHRDGNPLNNDIDNLECVTRKQHGERHKYLASDELKQHLAEIRPKATEWHRSTEGRRWHKEHGK